MVNILAVNGSLRSNCHTMQLVEIAWQAAEKAGAHGKLLDLRQTRLPLFEAHVDYRDHRVVQEIIQLARWADGFLVGGPEYHGSMSGALKNWFDFLHHELSGKLMGLFAATGGSQGTSALLQMRIAAQYCHAWALPYQTAARGADFDADDRLSNPKVLDRLRRIGRDVAVYAPLLRERFQQDLGDTWSFAQWHEGKI